MMTVSILWVLVCVVIGLYYPKLFWPLMFCLPVIGLIFILWLFFWVLF